MHTAAGYRSPTKISHRGKGPGTTETLGVIKQGQADEHVHEHEHGSSEERSGGPDGHEDEDENGREVMRDERSRAAGAVS
jgi:hypothetical protein